GHAYTTVAADVAARYHRCVGDETFFLTGTDEHGAKIAEAARLQGKSTQEFTDEVAAAFREAWAGLDIAYDHFIRTTDGYHERGVQKFLQRMWDGGVVSRDRYGGLYCVGCEAFKPEADLADGLSPAPRIPPIPYAEDNYFFRLSQFRETLIRAIE